MLKTTTNTTHAAGLTDDPDDTHGTDIVAMTYDGTFDLAELDTARDQIHRAAHGNGNSGARVLLHVVDVDLLGLEPKAVWEDLKSADLLGDVERLSVLTDSTVIRGLASAAGVTPLQVEVYSPDRREDALAWLCA